MVERAGFPACYISGAALSASMGLPDVGLVTLTEFVTFASQVAAATSLPIISDADTGFGEALNVERTVQQFEAAGVAAIHLEDQILPKRCGHLTGKKIITSDEMVSKIRAAVAARRDKDFVIIARTDALSVSSFEDTTNRAKAYLAAGADMIFPEALTTAEEFAQFAKAVPAPLLANMTEFGQSPIIPATDLARMGYKIVIYPVTMLRLALQTVKTALASIKTEGDQASQVSSMLTRAELYDLLGYNGYEERDRAYFGKTN